MRPCTARTSVTNVPLKATPGSIFMWSFDRVVAGSAYTGSTVEPVLHRYNDAKYVWGDAAARTWLRGLVLAHGGASGTEGTGGAAWWPWWARACPGAGV